MKPELCKQIYAEAIEAGVRAGNNHNPTPMIVQQHANPLDDNSPVVRTFEPVMGGVCGFAWVNIKPGNSSFCRWLKSQGIVDHVSYYGGYDLWCSDFNQSMERKEAWADAIAKVLNSYGIKAHSMSRMD